MVEKLSVDEAPSNLAEIDSYVCTSAAFAVLEGTAPVTFLIAPERERIGVVGLSVPA